MAGGGPGGGRPLAPPLEAGRRGSAFNRESCSLLVLIGALSKGLRLPLLREFGRLRQNTGRREPKSGDQVIRENPANRGTETSAEVLVGPPLGAGGWSETPVNSK